LDVVRVESDGAPQVHGAEVAALDKSLHGSRVDMEEDRSLIRRQQGGSVGDGRGR
jgi:hypothetical protein